MAISFDKAFGIHQYTIGARSARAEVLSGPGDDAAVLANYFALLI